MQHICHVREEEVVVLLLGVVGMLIPAARAVPRRTMLYYRLLLSGVEYYRGTVEYYRGTVEYYRGTVQYYRGTQ